MGKGKGKVSNFAKSNTGSANIVRRCVNLFPKRRSTKELDV